MSESTLELGLSSNFDSLTEPKFKIEAKLDPIPVTESEFEPKTELDPIPLTESKLEPKATLDLVSLTESELEHEATLDSMPPPSELGTLSSNKSTISSFLIISPNEYDTFQVFLLERLL